MAFPSVMTHRFSDVPRVDIPRSQFDRSHGYKTTFDAGYLIPVFVDEALPGDTFNLNMSIFARLTTPIHPIMDNLYLDSHFFAVPYRLVWDNWEKFNGAQDNPADSTDFLVPTMDAPAGSGHAALSLSDYLGIPTGVASLTHVSLWHRAYNLIWNEWFRDENLQNSVVVDTDDGPDTSTDYALLRRGKRHDYFTSALPWPQKGTAVDLPIGSVAPIVGIGMTTSSSASAGPITVKETDNASTQYANYFTADPTLRWEADTTGAGALPQIYADLSAATAATINQLREAFQIQRMYERDARGGTRYVELILSHFGVTSPDQRLQRPEYLGGSSTPIVVSAIAQNSETGTTPQGNLAAMGTAIAERGHGFAKSFTEHCLLIGLVSVRADLNYQQGLPRMFSRSTRWDFYWPAFSHLGEQAILNKEIYSDGSANDDLVFGYQERYGEYRYKQSTITGQFRSQHATSLDPWHLAVEFASLPSLDATFIEENPPVDRVIAVPAEPHIYFDSYFKLTCARPMPVFGVPGLIDHF